jgi:hypothetical protein
VALRPLPYCHCSLLCMSAVMAADTGCADRSAGTGSRPRCWLPRPGTH